MEGARWGEREHLVAEVASQIHSLTWLTQGVNIGKDSDRKKHFRKPPPVLTPDGWREAPGPKRKRRRGAPVSPAALGGEVIDPR